MTMTNLNPTRTFTVYSDVYHRKLTQKDIGAARLSCLMLNLSPKTENLSTFSLKESKVISFTYLQKVILGAALYTFISSCSGSFGKAKSSIISTRNALFFSSSLMAAIVAFKAFRDFTIISEVFFQSLPFPRSSPETIYNFFDDTEQVYSTPVLSIDFTKEDINKPYLLNVDGQILTCLEFLKILFTKELSKEETLPHPITQKALSLEKHQDVLKQLLQVLNLSEEQFYSCWEISEEFAGEQYEQLLVEIISQNPSWFTGGPREEHLLLIDNLIKDEHIENFTLEKEKKTKEIFLYRRIDKFYP
ncbi:MAG: hypothetical protein L7U87_07800 [Chlamydiales bacterium]|nr:hypothetical protein [Chlamydiales bacterium]